MPNTIQYLSPAELLAILRTEGVFHPHIEGDAISVLAALKALRRRNLKPAKDSAWDSKLLPCTKTEFFVFPGTFYPTSAMGAGGWMMSQIQPNTAGSITIYQKLPPNSLVAAVPDNTLHAGDFPPGFVEIWDTEERPIVGAQG